MSDIRIKRKNTQVIAIGPIHIGGTNPVLIQSMTNTKTSDVDRTVAQIQRLEQAGCGAVRVAIPKLMDLDAFEKIKKSVRVPLIADVHFDYRIAIGAIKKGADKIRINPGNMGGMEKIKAIAYEAGQRNVPIRIGVNTGSLDKKILEAYGMTPQAAVESMAQTVALFESIFFTNLVLSIKSSDPLLNVRANEQLAERFAYPIHVGVTEAGVYDRAVIQSAVGIGALLLQGIGDTIRVSISGDPVEEVHVARSILAACGYGDRGVDIIACPTCGRSNMDIERIAKELSNLTFYTNRVIKVAVMGCEVNGPGEAKEADIGIAGGKNGAVLFKKGKILKKIPIEHAVDHIKEEIQCMIKADEKHG